MEEVDKHLEFRTKKVSSSDLKHIKSNFYKDIITEYGNWLEGLVCGRIQPITEDQEQFLSKFKRANNRKFNDLENKYVKAMYLWKGRNWINTKSLSLSFKNQSQKPKAQLNSFSPSRKSIEYLRKLKPKIKSKSVFPKLDPNKTYRWTDKGFQTREGHKIMSSKGYRNSKKK